MLGIGERLGLKRSFQGLWLAVPWSRSRTLQKDSVSVAGVSSDSDGAELCIAADDCARLSRPESTD